MRLTLVPSFAEVSMKKSCSLEAKASASLISTTRSVTRSVLHPMSMTKASGQRWRTISSHVVVAATNEFWSVTSNVITAHSAPSKRRSCPAPGPAVECSHS